MLQDPDLKVDWEDVDEFVREDTETDHSQTKTLGPTPDDEEWLPPDLKLEIESETIVDKVEVKESQDRIDQDFHRVSSQNLKRRGKTRNKIYKSLKNTYPILCPRCALVSWVPCTDIVFRQTMTNQSKGSVIPECARHSLKHFYLEHV